MFYDRFPRGTLAKDPRLTHSSLSPLTEKEFLACMVDALLPFNIALGDRFRRQKLFKTLDKLISSSSEDQAQQFRLLAVSSG